MFELRSILHFALNFSVAVVAVLAPRCILNVSEGSLNSELLPCTWFPRQVPRYSGGTSHARPDAL
jgi:hypothetical protein